MPTPGTVHYNYWTLVCTPLGAEQLSPQELHSLLVIAHNLLLLVFLEWQAAYQESLRKPGSVSVEVPPSILIGPPESGSSTLKYLLVHNAPKAVKTSTAVLETPEMFTASTIVTCLNNALFIGL